MICSHLIAFFNIGLTYLKQMLSKKLRVVSVFSVLKWLRTSYVCSKKMPFYNREKLFETFAQMGLYAVYLLSFTQLFLLVTLLWGVSATTPYRGRSCSPVSASVPAAPLRGLSIYLDCRSTSTCYTNEVFRVCKNVYIVLKSFQSFHQIKDVGRLSFICTFLRKHFTP